MASSAGRSRGLVNEFSAALKSFVDSDSTFRVFRTLRAGQTAQGEGESRSKASPERLYVLDSSFNPPTRGHLEIVLSALREDASLSKNVLLLLATQNADKASKPASFEQRLAMMDIFACWLNSSLTTNPQSCSERREVSSETRSNPEVTVYLGVTKLPYFIDKSKAIAGEAVYSSVGLPTGSSSSSAETNTSASEHFVYPPCRQTHLIGFDTLTRLFDPKYYGPSRSLAPLAPLFDKHSVRVTLRSDDGFGSRNEQVSYIQGIGWGSLDSQGADRAWAKQIHLANDVNGGDSGADAAAPDGDGDSGHEPSPSAQQLLSSTRAREAATCGDRETLVQMCGEELAHYVLQEQLY